MITLTFKKRKFGRLYQDYMKKLGDMSCGANLAEHISPELGKLKLELKEIYQELRKIDEKCPVVDWLEEKIIA